MVGVVVARSSSGAGPAKLWRRVDETLSGLEVSGRHGDKEVLEVGAEEKDQVGICTAECWFDGWDLFRPTLGFRCVEPCDELGPSDSSEADISAVIEITLGRRSPLSSKTSLSVLEIKSKAISLMLRSTRIVLVR